MNPGLLDYYRVAGQPATGTVTVVSMPAVADTVTINGIVYTYGSDGWIGRNMTEVAQYLAAAINADRNRMQFHAQTNPINAVYAVYYGNVVRIIATEPGTSGNSITQATSNSTAFVVSGATLASGAGPTSVTTGAPRRCTWVKGTAYTSSVTPNIPTVIGGTLYVRYVKLVARAANTDSITVGPSSAADMETVSVGLPVVISPPEGTSFNLGAWYGSSPTASQTFDIYYCPE